MVNCLTGNRLYSCTRPVFMKWKTLKRIKDRIKCESRTKRGDVHEGQISVEEKLLIAIFGERKIDRYQCKVCNKWHTI